MRKKVHITLTDKVTDDPKALQKTVGKVVKKFALEPSAPERLQYGILSGTVAEEHLDALRGLKEVMAVEEDSEKRALD